MQVPCAVYIFDFDGVIVDYEGAPRGVGVEAVRQAAERGVVYIVSGRPARDRGKVLRILRELGLNGLVEAVVLGRSRGEPEEEYKYGRALELLSTEGCILEIHDDNPKVLDRLSGIPRGGLILHYDNSCTPVRGRASLPACQHTY